MHDGNTLKGLDGPFFCFGATNGGCMVSRFDPQGMSQLEVNGGKQKTGTLIGPNGDATILVHGEISRHMEQGLKGQFLVGRGRDHRPSIPGASSAIA